MRFQNIADTEIDAATAANFINSQLKAFGNTSSLQKFTGDFEKAQHIIDATNETANNFAVGTNDLQNALTKAGSALSVAGNSFEQTIGMVTAGTEIMVGQPAKVGRGLRTIAINISKLAQGQSELEVANGKYTVSLQDQEGQMRSTYDIMSDLGDIWGDLNETEQTALATQLAGKTQFEVFSNIMKNWESAVRATTTAQDAQGSSLRENARYLDSIEGKLQNFQSAWEQLSYHLINSDMIKGVIDFGTTIITTIDNIVQEIGALPTAIGMLGIAFGGLKLFKIARDFVSVGTAATAAAEGVEAVGAAASATGGANVIGKLSSALSMLTNPAVIAGVVALGTAIAAIEFDKYFSFDSSIKRLEEYQDKSETVTQEIEELKKKRSSDEGLTDSEKTHLAVLEAEERSLQRQIELEKERAKAAFKKDASSSAGKAFQERTGPKELLAYNDALDKQVQQYEKIAKLRQTVEGFQKAKDMGLTITPEQQALWEEADRQLQKMELDWADVKAATSKAGFELSQYWENVKDAVPYEELDSQQKQVYDNLHKSFLLNQIDIDNLKDGYTDVLGALSGAMDSLGSENLNLFDNIDMSSLKTVEDVINAVKEQIQSLGDDTEIEFNVKNADGEIEKVSKKVSELTDEDYEAIINFNEEGISKVDSEADDAARKRLAKIMADDSGTAKSVGGKIDDAAKKRNADINVTDNNTAGKTQGKISGIKGKDVKINVNEGGDKSSGVQSHIDSVKGKDVNINIFKNIYEKIFHSATGKRKGEKGGMSWLGDEGTAQNPKPELVVGEDGAYLAGTEGWEMRQLKSTDTVYTHAQTKKLLGGKQTFAGTASPLPMYAKGKKGKGKKKSTSSASKPKKTLNQKVKSAQKEVNKKKSTYNKAKKTYKKNKSKKNKKAMNAAKKQLNKSQKKLNKVTKKRDKTRTSFDNALAKLQHKREVNHWTDEKFQKEYKKLINKKKYKGALSQEQTWDYEESREDYENQTDTDALREQADNILTQADLDKYIEDVNKNNNLSKDEKADLIQSAGRSFANTQLGKQADNIMSDADLSNFISSVNSNAYLNAQEKASLIQNAGHKLSTSQLDRQLGNLSMLGGEGGNLSNIINAIKSNQYLNDAEKAEYTKKAYQEVAQYNLKAYQSGKMNRDKALQGIKDYYAQVGEADETYYQMLDELRKEDQEKEVKRLNELQDKQDKKMSYLKKYAQKQKDYYDEQVSKEKEEAEQLEKLVELQKDLNDAKKTMVKIYREGVGFVYEKDTEAIRKAQKALNDYKVSNEKTEAEQQAENWQKVLDLIGDIEDASDTKELEIALGISGVTGITGSDIGTDLNKWSKLVKEIVAQGQGYADIAKVLSEASDSEIESLLGATLEGGNKQISSALLSQYFAKHSFASGSLSTPSGLSLLGENGPEIGWLNKGSTVFSNLISKNLMEWGQYNPAQVLNSTLGSNQSQVFNFDKIVLPNVRNAEDFYKELQLLPNKAIQQSASRI